jgi:hypothetical protein
MTASIKRYRPVMAMAALVVGASTMANAQYTFVKIKIPMTGAKSVSPQGISNNNDIVGSFRDADMLKGATFGFLRTGSKPTQWTYLQDPAPAGKITSAQGVNSSKVVVGYFRPSPGLIDGLVYFNGTYSTYNEAGCKWSYVNGINDQGDLTGDCFESGKYKGWLYTSGNGETTFFTIPGATNTYTTSINSLDSAGGWYFDGAHNHGYVRTAAGAVTTYDYAGAISTWVFGVSDVNGGNQWVTGVFENADATFHAYLNLNGTFSEVQVPGAIRTGITGVNGNGWFVGSYEDANGKFFAFYAKPSAGPSTVVDEE